PGRRARQDLRGRAPGGARADPRRDEPGRAGRRQIVIEAATEDAGTKREVFRRLDEVTPPDSVLASNTSSIPIVELASVTKRPDKVLGMHFFNPVPVMGLIELVRAITTSEETVE